jgi:Protein of unknown function (DUF1524)
MASRSRKQSKRGRSGGGGPVGGFVAAILAVSIIVAFFKIPGHQNAEGTLNFFESKAQSIENWVGSWSDQGIDLSGFFSSDGKSGQGTGQVPGVPGIAEDIPKDAALASLQTVVIADAQEVPYNRDEWKHWSAVRTCWDTREEVLYRQAEPGTAILTDKNKKPTNDINSACYITGGTWIDPYTGKTIKDPSALDIDHMVPLKYAATHGGQPWDGAKKEQFANSLEPGHLLAVDASANRQKSDKGPSNWVPQEAYQCQYAKDWVGVTSKWGLSVTQADKDSMSTMLAKCA